MSASEQALARAREMARTADYLAGAVPSELLSAASAMDPSCDLFIPYKKRQELDSVRGGYASAEELVAASWEAARSEQAFRCYEDKLIFPLDALRPDGETPAELSVTRGDPDKSHGRPWFVTWVWLDPPHRAAPPSPTRAIEEFAWMGWWEDFLSDLAEIALPERWCFAHELGGERTHSILKSYVCNTYYRLMQEGKVCVSADGQFAAFNTGLVDRRFDDIYLCFEPQAGEVPWRFVGFAATGNRALRKRVNSCFNPLPQTASYFSRIDDLLFDPDRELEVDYDHILVDNVGRLPLGFLASELAANPKAAELVRRIQALEPSERAEPLGRLADLIEADPRAFRSLRSAMEDAIGIARRRVRWNYKTAIPSYYPRADQMSLLLPVCLMDDQRADVALVVELKDSGIYQGQTILTLEQAYTNARLVCRPDSDWLTTGE